MNPEDIRPEYIVNFSQCTIDYLEDDKNTFAHVSCLGAVSRETRICDDWKRYGRIRKLCMAAFPKVRPKQGEQGLIQSTAERF